MSLRTFLTCRLLGHLWTMGNYSTTPDPQAGTYIVHNLCLRCDLYRIEERSAVPLRPKEQ